MKVAFISDIHGVASSLAQALAKAESLGCEKIVLLGDLLYHGPRNGVPGKYDPVETARLLNERKEMIVAVRGNCDAEVDGMMLEFPIDAPFAELDGGKEKFFITHGHLWNADKQPTEKDWTVLVHGHTHISVLENIAEGKRVWNPGSVSLPKGGTKRSFGFYDGERIETIMLEDNENSAVPFDSNCAYCAEGKLLDAFGIKICDLAASKLYLFKEQSHRGRVIVAAKKHVSELVNLDKVERDAFFADVAKVANAIHKVFSPNKINYGAYGDTGCHLHFHLVPKYRDDEFEWGGVFAMNPARTYLSEKEYSDMVESIKAALA
jgi:putative phosphoesterase